MTGIELITKERKRQIDKKGWTNEHDDQHTDQSLSMAAACYAAPTEIVHVSSHSKHHLVVKDPFPWSWTARGRSMMDPDYEVQHKTKEKKKGKSRIKQLAIAGALIVAEIDRLQRQ